MRMRNASAPYKFAYTARAVRAKKNKTKQKKYCESKAYMKHHPNHSLSNIMVFSAPNNSKIVKVNLIFWVWMDVYWTKLQLPITANVEIFTNVLFASETILQNHFDVHLL